MSRSNNVDIPNPAIRFYQWNGAKGGFQYWDKEKEVRVEVPLPFRFMVLDTLSTIRGFSDSDQSGFWSNEVRDIRKDTLNVRTKKGLAASGLYNRGALLAAPLARGAKFCQSVYIAVRSGDKLAIANIQLTGAALSSWIEFRKKEKDIYAGVIEVSEMAEGKKGAVTFQMPVFKKIPSNASADAQANALDVLLQKFLASYFARTQEHSVSEHTHEEVEEDIPLDSDIQDAPIQEEEIGDEDLPF